MKRGPLSYFTGIVLLSLIIPRYSYSQVVINEFMASNTGIIVDSDYKESADWIELYNSGDKDIVIGGFYLSDNFNDSKKWQIPEGTIIAADSFIVIWADGKNTGLHTLFKLSAEGEELALFSKSGNILDSLTYGMQKPNISMGRKTNGSEKWGFFMDATPGETNSTEYFEGIIHHVPDFSVSGGIFNSPISLEISTPFNGQIHFTRDGSEPGHNSPVVTGPVVIDTTSIIRSRILQTGKIPGEVITHSYFIDTDNKIGSLPVVSIASDPENFWDPIQGIYVQDFKPEWEVPINIELFENDGSDRAAFNLRAGTKVNGLHSWRLPQKMLGIYFRKQYGKGKLEYPLLFDRERRQFDNFALRASGSDWAYSLFRDAMTQSLTDEYMDVDFQGSRACIVFINGQYMGIHNIRSKINEDFIIQNHSLEEGSIDMVENENYVEAGSLDQYAAFEELYKNDLTIQENYISVSEQMDIENFTNFMITEIYSQNTSVDHNIMAWKPKEEGKWKWILNDLDRGFFKSTSNMIDFYANRNVIPFKQLLRNESYRRYFGIRLADHLFVTFNSERVKSIIENFKKTIESEIPKHIIRWEGTTSSYGNPVSSVEYWENEVGKMKKFADNRATSLLNDLQKYGFSQSEALSVSVSPDNAGTIDFNGLIIKHSFSQGAYPINEDITLNAKSKSGYEFKGWVKTSPEIIIEKEDTWKYNDTGTQPQENWKTLDYDDSEWGEGKAELGYGDGDENTILSFGGDDNNKIITTYFRKAFQIEHVDKIEELIIGLKCDDGAVVYINGTEVIRENLPAGEITPNTKTINSISGSAEDIFKSYEIDKAVLVTGNNILAVELHQSDEESSDISFDLELFVLKAGSGEFFSTNPVLNYTHHNNTNLTAIFQSDGSCILPEEINAELILNKECSPYLIPNNVKITSGGKLFVKPGVELWFSDDVSMEINGILQVEGTTTEPVIFRSNPQSTNKKWGILNFVNADTSYLHNVILEDASKGNHPLREIAAISAFHSVLTIDGATIENVHENPILGRYSDLTVLNSRIHSKVSGDLINIKYGKGYIDSCEFVGNEMPDTDAVDFDDVENGIIQNSTFFGFYGFNSDAIDIGEKARNITIENVATSNITDKGVSVGQQSTARIFNSIFVNSDMGIAVKDSSRIKIDHCTFYGNGTPVACYEKNIGNAGGNAIVTNSILSNAYNVSFLSDGKSTIAISNSASDNNTLPSGTGNLFVNPQFSNPNQFNFSLEIFSPCIGAATDGNMGANLATNYNNQLFISGIAYMSDLNSEINEFVVLSNAGSTNVDISGYTFTKGISYTFPEGEKIQAGQNIYIAYQSNSEFWKNRNENVYQWEDGRLADEGETLELKNKAGIIIDQVLYNKDDSWPDISAGSGLVLKGNNLDNHFGKNWEARELDFMLGIKEELISSSEIIFYPNPTSGILNISGSGIKEATINIYNLSGILVRTQTINSVRKQINLKGLPGGIYLIRIGDLVERVILKE